MIGLDRHSHGRRRYLLPLLVVGVALASLPFAVGALLRGGGTGPRLPQGGAAGARFATLEPLWTKVFARATTYYVPTLDASQRGTMGLLQYFSGSDTMVVVGIDGSETPVPVPPLPTPSWLSTHRLDTGAIESDNGLYLLIFDDSAVPTQDGWELPIPSATLYAFDDTPLATFRNVQDWGFISNDGSHVATFAGPDYTLKEGRAFDPVSLRFYSGHGQLLADVDLPVEPDPQVTAYAPDGSALVAYIGNSLIAYGPSGSTLWTHDVTGIVPAPMFPPGMVVSNNASYTAFNAQSAAEPHDMLPVRVLDSSGNLAHTLNITGPTEMRFNASATHLALIELAKTSLVNLQSGAVTWSLAPPQGFVHSDVAVTDDARRVAIATRLLLRGAPYDPGSYPYELAVDVYDVAAQTQIAHIEVPRDDPQAGLEPPIGGPDIEMSDDGAYLYVGNTRTLSLYRLP